MKNLISICIPAYYGEKTISRTISSIVSQDYKNFEILISVYKNKKKIIKICRNFKKKSKKIKIYVQNKKLTGVENHNFLLNKVKGIFFLVVHDDDYISKKYLTNGIKLIESDQDASAVYGSLVSIFKNKIISKSKPLFLNSSSLYVRLKNFIIYRYGDMLINAITRTKKNNYNYSKTYLNPEIPYIMDMVGNGKILICNKMNYYKNFKPHRNIQLRAKFYNVKLDPISRYGIYIAIFFKILSSRINIFSKLYLLNLFLLRLFIFRNFYKKKLI